MNNDADWFENKAVEVLATLRGYSEDEIENALVEDSDEYDSDIASDVAYLTSALRDASAQGGDHG